jgi:hypothetical protein
MRWRGPTAIVNDRPILSFDRIMTASVHFENEITGRESQGACSQDELIGGKQPVAK